MRGRKIWLIWGVLIVLGAVIWHAEVQRSNEISAMSLRTENRLLPAPIDEISVVEIMVKGTMHRFERAENRQWFYHGIHDASQPGHEHGIDPAQSEAIATAMTGFGRMQGEQRIPLKAGEDEYGITRPDIFIIVYRNPTDEPLARYATGMITPDGYGRYLLPVGGAEIVTVPEFHIKNLLDLIDTMKSMAANGANPAAATETTAASSVKPAGDQPAAADAGAR